MTEELVFWAQALDNTSPDHIEFRGRNLSLDNSVRREHTVSAVSKVVKGGSRIFEEGGVRLTADGPQFVVEVPSAERDCTGRIAPIICRGEYVRNEEWSVVAGISEFAESIGRTISPDDLELTLKSLSSLKDHLSTRRVVRVVGVTALALALELFYRLSSKGS